MKAAVIGSGPNGLSAAIVLAQAGMDVEVFEAQPTPGGGARSMELTLPGFQHDFGSAVHPLGIGSPFFASLGLERYGLEWLHSPAALAHPLDDGTASILYQDLSTTAAALGRDGDAWCSLMEPFSTRWTDLTEDILGPPIHFPRHPFLLARFGRDAILPATTVARTHFTGEPARALFAGIAAHSFLALDSPLSASFGMVLAIAGHAVGWPIPRGGAQAIADALAACLRDLGGTIHVNSPIDRLSDIAEADVILCDITPRQLLAISDGGAAFTPAYRRQLQAYRYGPGVFKVDYALSSPIPWTAPTCASAATVHLGGTLEEIAASESAIAQGRTARRPFVLLSQPTLFDPTRAPVGKHIAWAYCHVPNGCTEDMLPRLEAQIERFAPGFSATILARHVSTPAILEALNPNLIGGDISGGAITLRQFILRPTPGEYRTSAPNVYLCSSSTPPGGGVHGMCGFHAARTAIRDLARKKSESRLTQP
ncbi:MAG TPA: NAD(P)/FAD-dependent oxidoreductase [Acidobacteriaceae bacterium]|jgi:phytoene dehydrogenase-like protein|nr:NAD(P)/FAD-dependent oxidoreductase [Acidobacteriaceae bacterium]